MFQLENIEYEENMTIKEIRNFQKSNFQLQKQVNQKSLRVDV